METLNSTTEKLVKATERLLQKFEQERAERSEAEARIKELEAQVERLNNELSAEKQASENLHISNPTNQSQNTATLSAESIDALVEEIDACLNLLKI
tara:strand:+ start:101 stop:391 length:291 start_codon:yes stop_codon:yes gene_type:complete